MAKKATITRIRTLYAIFMGVIAVCICLFFLNVFTSAVTRSDTEEYTVTGGESGMKLQMAKPDVSTGYTISDAITYTVTSGNPATVDSDGLVTRTGVGVVTVTMVYSEIMTGVETWDLTNTPVADDTEDTIFQFHFRDYTNPNAVVRYVYDGLTHTYYLYVTSSKATILYIDALPLSGYTVVINDGTNTTTLTSASTSVSSVNIAASA